MDKYFRTVDPEQLNQSKQRTMNVVMDQIHAKHAKKPFFRSILRPVLLPTMILVFALFVIFSPGTDSPTEPFIVSAQESQTLAEISYLSTSIIGANITLSNNMFQFLAATDTTEFESETDKINVYFDMLKVFLEDDIFSETVTVTELTDSIYTQLIEFTSNDTTYQFYISITDGVITGELHVGIKIFDVTGTLEEDDGEYSVELEAVDGNDFVTIHYQTEANTETETKYEIQSRINGVSTSQEIKVKMENNEAKVEIKEGDNEYQLKRETESGVTQYKLEYKINGTEGEAVITEVLDNLGVPTYTYQIKEGDTEKEISKGRPNYDYDEDEEDEEDEEDQENPGQQSEDPGNSDNSSDESEDPGSDNSEDPGSDNSEDPGNNDDAPGQGNDDDPEETQSTNQTIIEEIFA